jgi:LuxR family maltose regulon positive regulatory protein
VLVQILQTKLFVPGLHGRQISRPRLIRELDAALAGTLTLICAPAGFGKSTLLADWSQRTPYAVAWLSLDDGDNDPARFWGYIVAALQTIDVALGHATLALLQSPNLLSPDLLLAPLLNELAARPERAVLILDDYDVIENGAIHHALLYLLEHLPPQLHIMLLSRADPPWPLARWRIQGRLAEVRADDLRFTADEAAAFLQEVMGLRLSTLDITALESRTEGWAAGLQLAALSLQGVEDRAGFITRFNGSNRYIIDYLTEEVLSRLPADVQSFLLQSSILTSLCGALCDAVVEPVEGSPAHSQAILEQLEHANLFLIPLDDERTWYRYHHLFADVLRHCLRRLQPARLTTLHRRASAWYEQQAHWPEAIHHAFSVADYEQAARLIERIGIELFAQTDIQHSLDRWLSMLPLELVAARPRLCLIHAWLLFGHLDMAAALRRVEEAEAALLHAPSEVAARNGTPLEVATDSLAGEIAAMRAVVVAYTPMLAAEEALYQGRRALVELSPGQATFRCIAALAMGMAHVRQGDVAAAEEVLAQATHLGQAAGNLYLYGVAVAHLIAMRRARGTLRLALATCQQAVDWIAQRRAFVYPTFGGLYLNLADLLRERNELEPALRYAKEAVAHSDQEINPGLFIISRLVLLRVLQAQGAWPQVWALVAEIEGLAKRHPQVIQSVLLGAMTAQFQVAEAATEAGPSLAAALTWAQTTEWQEGEIGPTFRFLDFIYQYEHSRIARAQVLIAWAQRTGDRPLLHETLAYLARQQQTAAAARLLWFQIKLLVLQALAHDALGNDTQAGAALTQALRLAQPEGYLRIFLDEGKAMRRLLLKLRAQLDATALQLYAEQVVQAFNAQRRPAQASLPRLSTSVTPTGAQLVEPLTARELEILHLVYEGLSNREIAAQLVVTLGTVKKHLNNIFGKLGATSRTQALVAARAHDLL